MNAPDSLGPTRVLPFGDAAIAEAAGLIRAGQPVAIATETVYGLAADAGDPRAVARIYEAKGRPSFNPLIVHVADEAAARAIGEFDARAAALAKAFWPGPLTLVVPRRPTSGIARIATAGLETVAIRVPAHRAMQALLAAAGRPLAAPSANRSGGLSPTRAEHVLASLSGRIPLVIDDGACARGVESTIVAEIDGETRILRPGPISARAILQAIGAEGAGGLQLVDHFDASAPIAPGQLASHYAPSKPLRLHALRGAADEWMIGFGAVPGDATLSAAGDPTEAAARLFDLLHQADASDRPGIAVAPIPSTGLGAAINDRLRRAAHR